MIEVVGAILVSDQHVLIAQRPAQGHQPSLWEFPGGKVEPGEPPQESLRREILEEMSVEIKVGDFFAENTHRYGERLIHLVCYWARILEGEPKAIECQTFKWVLPSELLSYPLAPADIPIAEALSKLNRLDPSH